MNSKWLKWDVFTPALVLPEIMEEWVGDNSQASEEPSGNFGKNMGERNDYRKRDGYVHFVPVLIPEYEICVNHLTEEQKFQHIVQSYTGNQATYNSPRPYNVPAVVNRNRWEWGTGSVCNAHVNSFLGYWFNFNNKFSLNGGRTAVSTLLVYDSSNQHGPTHPNHRSYKEFITPVAEFTLGAPLDPAVPYAHHPRNADDFDYHYLFVSYIRINGRFFNRAVVGGAHTYTPTTEGRALIDTLGSFNVYSLSNIPRTRRDPHTHQIVGRDYDTDTVQILRNHGHPTATVANAGDLIWALDATQDAQTITALNDLVNWDHHGGVLVKRGLNGSPPSGGGTQPELWTFSADGPPLGAPIVFKAFDHRDMHRWHLHLSIFKLEPLRPGGMAPKSAEANAGSISIDEPPRFIDWV